MSIWKGIARRWNSFKNFDKNLVFFWLILSVLIILFHQNESHWLLYVLLHLSLIGVMFAVIPWLDSRQHWLWRLIRRWYIVGALPFLYMDVGPFLHLIFPGEFDPHIIHFDRSVFGVLPNIWVQKFVSPWVTEIMQISYSIYWVTIPLGGAIFYFSGKYSLYDSLMQYVTITFFVSYFIFIFFPVAGPRFFIADQIHVPYKAVFFGNYLRNFVTQVGYRGGAFPSSHVGVAVVVLSFMLKFRPKIGLTVFFPMVIALSLATVYGQYHYLGDVLAGLTMGIIIGTAGVLRTSKVLRVQSVRITAN